MRFAFFGDVVGRSGRDGLADHLPDLREDHHALASSGDPAVARYALVNIANDRIANSPNTLAMEVLAWEPSS